MFEKPISLRFKFFLQSHNFLDDLGVVIVNQKFSSHQSEEHFDSSS